MRNYYDKMLENSAEHLLSNKVHSNMFEFTEFLTQVLKIEDVGAALEGKATYLSLIHI